jgi:pimeloyl-ACP methyl ester carboxylesterase
MSLRPTTRDGSSEPLGSQELERALISGEHARVLETYFGEQEYAELTHLAASATRQARRGGPRVIILPGILGSMLARMKGDKGDRIWIDFLDIFFGRLTQLVLPDTGKIIRATDAHPGTYLKLKLWLRSEGFTTDDHPFDWRLSIPDLGAQLAKRIAQDPAQEVWLVAHSMGGLVARAAIEHGVPKLKRLIMLGTPNYGSFAPVMVFRGIYRFLKIIAFFDVPHSAAQLANETFTTFPGLTEMMPWRQKFSRIDLYDINAWPTKGPRPSAALLKRAPTAQAQIKIPSPDKAVMIAGVDQKTFTGLRVDGNEFVFEQTQNGDGTVPLDLAVIPGLETFYIREGHGELPKNRKVWQAVKELIQNQKPSLLEDKWSPSRAGVRFMTEQEVARTQQPPPISRGGELRAVDLRNFIEDFAAGPKPAMPVTPTAAIAEIAEPPFHSIVIGRRRQRRVEIRLAHGSVIQVKSRAYVIGLFQDVQPAGASLAIDAAMAGAITDFTQRRMMSNAVGEIFLLPRGRTDLRAEFVVFTGLGAFDRFDVQVVETVAENLARSAVHTNLEEFATVLFGANAGISLEDGVRAYLRGFLRGLIDIDAAQNFRALTVCEIDDHRYEALKWVLYRLSSTRLFEDVEVILSEIELPPMALEIPVISRGGALGSVATIYLQVRTEQLAKKGLRFCSAVLTSGAKATVISGEAEVAETKLNDHLALIEDETFKHDVLPKFGSELAQMILPPDVIAAVKGSAAQHLVIVHDAEASRIPWETIHFDGHAPALEGGVSRRYIAANMSVAKWLEQRKQTSELNLLLVVNPTSDLPGAEREGQRIEQLCSQNAQVQLKKLYRAEATTAALLQEFRSGKYDVLHYAGHAFFNPAHPARSGLRSSDGIVAGADLAGLATLPSLVFFNACESARVRKVVEKTKFTTRSVHERIERSVGLAEAFLRGGVANYLGTYWPVGDTAADTFARVFYTAVLKGAWLGQAVQDARKEVNELKSPDWADYLQYGTYEFALKLGSPRLEI